MEGGLGHFFEDFFGVFYHFEAVADHAEVVACFDCFLNGLLETDFVEDGSHVEVVGHDE